MPSPIIKKEDSPKILLSFSEAIEKVLDGSKITKIEWENTSIYGYIKDGLLILHKEDGKDYKWILNDGDIAGKDWIIIDNLN